MKELKGIGKMENSGGRSEAKPKRARVSQRKELAVVTVGMVAAIASSGSLLTGNQLQADQPADTAPAAQVSSATPGSPSEQQSKAQTPTYSPTAQDDPANAPHAQSQGS